MLITQDPLAPHDPFSFHGSVRFGVNTVVERKKTKQKADAAVGDEEQSDRVCEVADAAASF